MQENRNAAADRERQAEERLARLAAGSMTDRAAARISSRTMGLQLWAFWNGQTGDHTSV